MEAEEDDYCNHHNHDQSPLPVDASQQSDEQHCVSKPIAETEESPPQNDITVESSPLRDSITGDESVIAKTTEKDMIEPDMETTVFLGQRGVFSDVAESTEAEEKDVAEFVDDKVVYEMGLADFAENKVQGDFLVPNLPGDMVEESPVTVGLPDATDKMDGEILDATGVSEQDGEVSNVINLVGKTEVAENADEHDDAIGIDDKDLGVPVSLVGETAVEEGEKTNLVNETGEAVKMECVSSNSGEEGLTDLGGTVAEAVDMENAEGKTVGVDEMCVNERSAEAVKMENLVEETVEVKGMDMRDDGVEVLKIENVGDKETEVHGIDGADEIAEMGKFGSMVDETAEVKGMEVNGYTADETTPVEEIDVEEETAEADETVYLVDETVGSEETDANMACMVEETEGAEEVEEMDVAEEADEASRSSSGSKRKRGKNYKAPARVPSRKKVEEDVCFICFDGGNLVLCDRRGCPKAYHPSCINRDDAFFRSKGRWNCGWHLCSNCEKSAHYMCYTCTFSLCKGCIKNAVILCVRGNKGFCETCMRFVTLIEKNEHGDKEKGQIDFNDRNSWEFLFKEYWTDLKERLSLTFDELVQAKSPWKGSDPQTSRPDSPSELYDGNVDGGSGLEISENEESGNSKKRRAKKRPKSQAKETISPSMPIVTSSQGVSTDDNVEWASKELLEFVMHMRNGDEAVLSQFDVQALLLEYIKRNKLRDPRRKSQIICDSRLENLFGKPRVGHFEMLKLLESHFLIKEDSHTNDLQGSIADTESSQLEADGHPDASAKRKEKKRKTRKKGDERGLQSNLDDYAAIDIHNINLIYLRRNLMEYLIEDEETFHDKVVGSFVRIRISGSAQKQDLYRLVQVVGTSKASEPYKVVKRMTAILLEILNLNKTEVISIDIISNQEFTEDECKRLRQSMKCGILNRLTVGDLQEKAMSLQDVRVKDWMETEIVRITHLRDRASEKGRRKELRECVEKLQLLKTPEERQRRLEEIPEIHTDPKMDPSHESEDEDETDDRRQESYTLPRSTSFGRRTREPVSPGKGGSNLNDSWTGLRNYPSMNRDLSSNLSSKAFSNQGDDAIGSGEIINENSWSQGRDRDVQNSNKWEKQQLSPNSEIVARNVLSGVSSELNFAAHSSDSAAPPTIGTAQHAAKVDESEKIWRYQDPSGKVQGPFSIVQLRKWSNTGYFPADLRIWRASDKQEDSLLLTDVLAGKVHKDTPLVDNNFQKSEVTPQTPRSSFVGKPHGATLQLGTDAPETGSSNPHTNPTSFGQSFGGRWKPQVEVSSTGRPASASMGAPKYSGDRWSSDYGNSNNFTNLPSPTPSPGGTKEQQPSRVAASFLEPRTHPGGNGGLQPSSFTTDRSMQAPENDSLHSPTPKGMVLGPKNTNALQIHSQTVGASNQPHIQASTSPNIPWGMGAPENQSSVPRPGLDSQNQGWGPMPAGNTNMGWGATPPANANIMWGAAPQLQASAPAPASTNPGWIAPGQGPAAGNTIQGWAAHNPVQPPVNTNPGWVAPNQGPPPPLGPNGNPSWPIQSGNQSTWGNEHGNKNGDRFSNQRDGGSHGRDYGSGGKSWGMQSSFSSGGGGGSGGGSGGFSRPYKGPRVCIFYENGHCKKGAACDYMHN